MDKDEERKESFHQSNSRADWEKIASTNHISPSPLSQSRQSSPHMVLFIYLYIFWFLSLSLSLFLSSFIQSIGFRSHRRSSKQIFVKYFFNLLSSFYYYTLHTHLEQPPAPLSFFRLNSGENCNSQSQPALKAYKSRRQVK